MSLDFKEALSSVVTSRAGLKERALDVAAEGITIADARRPQNPILYANAGFERLTGYGVSEVVGRNCRFLQGRETDPTAVERIRTALRAKREITVEILNYRKDRTPFWNRLSITPVRDASGEVAHYIGVQSDITERKGSEESLKKTNRDLRRAYRRMKHDLDAAARIQRSLLPRADLEIEGVRFAWEYRPCHELAGDFLNVLPLSDRHVGLFVLDVSGHGVSAALLSVTLSRWLSEVPGQSVIYTTDGRAGGFRIARPSEVAERLNRLLAEEEPSQYFTMVYGLLDRMTGELSYVAAGHPGPVLQRRGAEPVASDSTAPPIGLLDNQEFPENRFVLEPGDRVFLYTDGLTEAENRFGGQFEAERLVRSLALGNGRSLCNVLRELLDDVNAWSDHAAQRDDQSILAIERS